MKKINKIIIFVLAISVFSFNACTEKMEDLNVDEKGLTIEDLQRDYQDVGAFIPGMLRSIILINPEWQYQLQQNLNADIYSGYMMSASSFANGNNPQYSMNDFWNGYGISIPFSLVMTPYLDLKNAGVEEKYPDFNAILSIIKVFAMHRVVDIYGPISYTQFGQEGAVFDSEEEAYAAFFNDLGDAIEVLTKQEKDNPDYDARFTPFDASNLGGDYKAWVQLANSLRLRLAMRISKVNSTEAQKQAEAAINHEFGVLESGVFEINHTFNHPLATLSGGWNDILMGAPMESFMVGYNDPRLAAFFMPATDAEVEGQYKGIRNGVDVGSAKTKYIGYSFLNFTSTDAVQLMTAAETHFLRAEAALNGWSTGSSAEAFYESGITTSFEQYGLDASTYLEGTSLPIEYLDTKNDTNSIKSGSEYLSTIYVKWEEADSPEIKFEKIITQKWIAMFPDGQEAWSEFRRTGYPKLFPVAINLSDDIPDGEFIKRLPYPSFISSSNPTAVENAVSAYLDGKDKMSTPLWWDVD